jgi:hypothetical protein
MRLHRSRLPLCGAHTAEVLHTEFTLDVDPFAFARSGRGVSFHDFVLAPGIPAAQVPVESCMHEYLNMPRLHSPYPRR